MRLKSFARREGRPVTFSMVDFVPVVVVVVLVVVLVVVMVVVVDAMQISGKFYKCSTIVDYDFRVVIQVFF